MASQKMIVRQGGEFLFFQLCRQTKWCSEKLSALPCLTWLDSDSRGMELKYSAYEFGSPSTPWLWIERMTSSPILESKWWPPGSAISHHTVFSSVPTTNYLKIFQLPSISDWQLGHRGSYEPRVSICLCPQGKQYIYFKPEEKGILTIRCG